uniref:Uncharacterized protein n=1 Tax=Rhizophora mucronata TaxID=61149 RepID=A0A2P2J6W7_RHIMU
MKLFSLFLILILLLQVVAGHQLLGNNANLPETVSLYVLFDFFLLTLKFCAYQCRKGKKKTCGEKIDVMF